MINYTKLKIYFLDRFFEFYQTGINQTEGVLFFCVVYLKENYQKLILEEYEFIQFQEYSTHISFPFLFYFLL